MKIFKHMQGMSIVFLLIISLMSLLQPLNAQFSLGIEFSYMKYPFNDQPKPVTLTFAALAARYYF
jgi:hypothetical protein